MSSVETEKSLEIIVPIFGWNDLLLEFIGTASRIKSLDRIILVNGKPSESVSRKLDLLNDLLEESVSFLLIEKEDNGIFDAMNKGAVVTRSSYVCFFGSDDLPMPENMDSLLEAMHESNADVGYSNVLVRHRETVYERKQYWNKLILLPRMLNHQSVIFRSSLFRQELYDPDLKMVADFEYYLRLMKKWPQLKVVNRKAPIVIYETRGFSSNKNVRILERKKVIKQYYPGLIGLPWNFIRKIKESILG
jgi:glycosyltransferase involved in cell wall biosynthesis